jgi:hypothetical protein
MGSMKGMAGNAEGFLSCGGDLASRIAVFDWSATPLGPIGAWPASLKQTLGFMLPSPVPLVLLWGEQGVMLYNDAYSRFAGARDSRLLGSNVREGWDEVADFNDNVMKVGLSGDTLSYRDHVLTLHRDGHPEQVRLNLDYSRRRQARGRDRRGDRNDRSPCRPPGSAAKRDPAALPRRSRSRGA